MLTRFAKAQTSQHLVTTLSPKAIILHVMIGI